MSKKGVPLCNFDKFLWKLESLSKNNEFGIPNLK